MSSWKVYGFVDDEFIKGRMYIHIVKKSKDTKKQFFDEVQKFFDTTHKKRTRYIPTVTEFSGKKYIRCS